MKSYHPPVCDQQGYYTITTVVFVSVLILSVIRSASMITSNVVKSNTEGIVAAEVFYAAERALSEALTRLPEPDSPAAVQQLGSDVHAGLGASGVRVYRTSFWFQQHGKYIRAFARAEGNDGSSATVSQWLLSTTANSSTAALLGVDGTVSEISEAAQGDYSTGGVWDGVASSDTGQFVLPDPSNTGGAPMNFEDSNPLGIRRTMLVSGTWTDSEID